MSQRTRNQLIEVFREAANNLELFPLDNASTLDRFAIEYDLETLEELAALVEDSPSQSSKIIFSGHTGCGKSTLLAALAQKLHDRFFVVRFSIANTIENADVNHVTILFAIALKIMQEAEIQNVTISPKIKESLLNWFAKKTKSEELKVTGEASIGAKLLELIGLKLKVDAVIRQEIKQEFERKVSELVAKLNEIAAIANGASGKNILVIIDDIDKLEIPVIRDVFINNIKALFLPNLQIIYTLPISALHDKDIVPILETETSDRIVPMRILKLYKKGESRHPDPTPVMEIVDKLEKLLAKRIDLELFEPEALQKVIAYSGGVLREVIRIVQQSCRICLRQLRSLPEDGDVSNLKISLTVVEEAANNLRLQMSRPLGKVDYEILKTVYQYYAPDDPRDSEFLGLLKGLPVLEYRNAREWHDVHPLLWQLVQERLTP
ncbi:type II secretory pathway, ATPase PulE/Tfp pilus assembly pathway, ATPase PilB [Pseudanabaena sp. lw0831]|uniref:P-loop NTPase fold protein n=1 Tax=Pseudanabaena sp. lw0831 TaxID=1357935 RepID=UPI001915E47A|nr:P-loop NTPase fold protein [Pseudanabaena sp. lw0831]GBO55493.1 type II secretory pathway, ATPase PulE/Tfp pilus assembly pathway, ATPase PilB [Pseudanabaena sp. lw0831]